MKKINYLMLGLAGLAMASCSQEDVTAPNVADGYAVTVKLPADLGTRAYGQGYVAQDLLYAVYETDAEGELISGNPVTVGETIFPANSLETTVEFNLANGKYYSIAFFAESNAARTGKVYNFNPEDGTMTVNYENMTSANNNLDAYDCFYKLHPTGIIGDATTNNSPTVILTRPVAQINWGTSDYNEDAITDTNSFGPNAKELLESTFTAYVYTTFDLFTRGVSDQTTIVIGGTAPFAAPDQEYFPVEPETYDYVAMQYVLAPVEATVYDLNLTIEANENGGSYSDAVYVNNAPVQANYRTNIYGALLTDNLNVNVVKDPIWNQPDYDIDLSVWDGQKVSYPTVIDNVGIVYSVSDIAGIAEQVNNGETFEGVTFKLSADFDMGGYPFAGIGSGSRDSKTIDASSKVFKGVFDGQGHTISNLTVEYTGDDADAAVGFIPVLDGAEAAVKNVNFRNVNINGGAAEQASIVGLLSDGATISDVNVNGGSIQATEAAAGIVGRVMGTGTVSSCSNSADITATGTSSGNAGGIAGAAYYTVAPGITIENCTNSGNIAVTGVNASPGTVGGIVGTSGANIEGCINNGNVSTTGSTAGGIVGYQNSCGSIMNCTNNGDVTGGSYTAGIIGWVGAGVYDLTEQIMISGNRNNGTVKGSGAAGIMTINRNNCTVENNTNNAPAIIATGTAAGIISGGYTDGNYYITLGENTNLTPADDITGSKTSTTYLGTFKVNGQVETYN